MDAIICQRQRAHGLDSSGRLARAVADINRRHADADGCLFLGDLTEDGATESYLQLRSILSGLMHA